MSEIDGIDPWKLCRELQSALAESQAQVAALTAERDKMKSDWDILRTYRADCEELEKDRDRWRKRWALDHNHAFSTMGNCPKCEERKNILAEGKA